ncbi:MAG: cardiolipin synthase [Bacteroidaceae bacterium]|nr:cardiolipin synthase [Bacteroidaceae bacterium]
MPDWLITGIEIAYALIVIGVALATILSNRSVHKTLAWVIIVVFLPVIGLILYLFFGQDNRKVRLISKRSLKRIVEHPVPSSVKIDKKDYPEKYASVINLMSTLSPSASLFGANNIRIESSGSEFFLDLLKDISQAKQYINIQFYIFLDDALGRLVSDVLIEKASQGIKIKVLYDSMGCWNVKKSFFKRMQNAGIDVESYLPVRFPRLARHVNYRNHRKLVIIDGHIGYLGGMNIAKRYLKGVKWGTWRDTNVRIEGHGVYGLEMSFLTDWCFAKPGKKEIRTEFTYPEHSHNAANDNIMLQIATTGPVGAWREMMQGYMHLFAQCKEYLYIETPYFIPTESIRSTICNVALAGCDVRLIIPKHSDTRFVHAVSQSYLQDFMDAGVKVYSYKPGFLHSKLLVMDGDFVSIGSTNIDCRSFENNFEINAFIYDRKIAAEAHHQFIKDQGLSERLYTRHWKKRSHWRKFKESVLRLLSPLL